MQVVVFILGFSFTKNSDLHKNKVQSRINSLSKTYHVKPTFIIFIHVHQEREGLVNLASSINIIMF